MSTSQLLLAFVLLFGGSLGLLLVGWKLLQRRSPEEAAPTPAPAVDAALAHTELTKRLRQSGLDPDPEAFLRRWRMGALAAAIVGIVMGGFGPGGILFGGMLGYATWRGRNAYLLFKWNQRMSEFLDQFTDALGVMANGVKSGQTVLQTFETIATDFGEPIRSEVTEVLQELRMGVPMDTSLAAWAERIPLEDLEIATTALIVQRQTGGNVAEILDTVAETIRQRNKLQKQIRTLTTQGRMSGWVLGLLPVGLFLAMFLIAPERTGLLLTHPIGMLMTAFGAAMIAAGGFFIQKIVTIEV